MNSALRFLINLSVFQPLGFAGFNKVGFTCFVIYLFCSSNSFGFSILFFLQNKNFLYHFSSSTVLLLLAPYLKNHINYLALGAFIIIGL